MPSSIALIPSGDTTGATDTAAVNTALGNAGAGGSVLLGPGNWYTHAPLAVPAGVELAGIKGAINGGGPEFQFQTFNGNVLIRKAK